MDVYILDAQCLMKKFICFLFGLSKFEVGDRMQCFPKIEVRSQGRSYNGCFVGHNIYYVHYS